METYAEVIAFFDSLDVVLRSQLLTGQIGRKEYERAMVQLCKADRMVSRQLEDMDNNEWRSGIA